jgi:hypothetical protein
VTIVPRASRRQYMCNAKIEYAKGSRYTIKAASISLPSFSYKDHISVKSCYYLLQVKR